MAREGPTSRGGGFRLAVFGYGGSLLIPVDLWFDEAGRSVPVTGAFLSGFSDQRCRRPYMALRQFMVVSLVFALILAAGCQPQRPSAAEGEKAPAAGAATAAAGVAPAKPIGPGDAEASLRPALCVEPDPAMPNVAVVTEQTARKDVSLCTVSVTPPYPTSLKATLTLKLDRPFGNQPVVVRGVLRRDDQPVLSINTVLQGRKPLEVGGSKWPMQFEYDMLMGVSQPPKSMLFDAQFTLEVTPPGTDPATLDPGKPAGENVELGFAISNPLRVDFVAVDAPK